MREIKLTGGYVTKVDDGDYEALSKYHWHHRRARGGNKVYAGTSVYVGGKGAQYKRRQVFMHRLIMGVVDAGRSVEVDHINGDSLDNRRANLRICTSSENKQNIRNSTNAAGYKGVNVIRPSKKYRKGGFAANIVVRGVRIYLGFFETAEMAALVYNAAAISYFGNFAALNQFPDEVNKTA